MNCIAGENLKCVTESVAADILSISPRTLEKWRREGGGPKFIRMSHKCVRYRIADIEIFQEERLTDNNIDKLAN